MTARLVKKRLTPTGKIRAAVFARAGGRCEALCGIGVTDDSGQLDHFFGRTRVKESTENCWALCVGCHDMKTRNSPTAERWARRFLMHAAGYNYFDAADMALAKLRTISTKQTFNAVQPRSNE